MAAGGNGRQGRRTKGGPLPLLALLFAGWALSPGQAQPPGGSDGNTTALDCADTDALLLACDADGMALAPPPPAPTGGQLPPASLRLPERDRLCAPACLDNLVACAASAPTPLLAYAARTCTDDQAAQPALDAACAAAFASACEPAAAWEQGGASTRLCSLECSALVDRAGCRARLGVSSADVGGLCDRIAAAPPGSPTAPACLAQLTESPCFQPLLAGDSGTGSSALLTQLRGASSIRAAGWGSSAAPCGPGCSELAASDCGLAVLGSDAPGAIANHCSACDEKYATACEGGPPWSDVSSLPSASLSAALASPLWERCSPACAAFATDAPDCFSDSATPATDASQCSPELPACMEAVLTDCAVDATAGNGPGRPPLPSSGLPSALCSPACVQRLLDDTACAATLKEAVFGGVDLQTELPQICADLNVVSCNGLYERRCEPLAADEDDADAFAAAICSPDCVGLLDGVHLPDAAASCSPLWATRMEAAGLTAAALAQCPPSGLPSSCQESLMDACVWQPPANATSGGLLDNLATDAYGICTPECANEVVSGCVAAANASTGGPLSALLDLPTSLAAAFATAKAARCVNATHTGRAHNGLGYLDECRVFADANHDGLHDPWEAGGDTTEGLFNFTLTSQLDGALALDGNNTACRNLASNSTPALHAMTAPSGCAVLSPVSWLGGALVERGSLSQKQAASLLSIAFGTLLPIQAASTCQVDALRAVGECGGGNAIALLRAEHYVGTFVLAASAAFCPLSSESDCSLPPSLGGPDLQPRMLSALADYLLAYETPAPAAAGQPPSGQGLPELDMAEETVLRAVLQVVADTLAVGADGQQWRRTLAAEELDGLAQAIANGLQVVYVATRSPGSCTAALTETSHAAHVVHRDLVDAVIGLDFEGLPQLADATSVEVLQRSVDEAAPLNAEWPSWWGGAQPPEGSLPPGAAQPPPPPPPPPPATDWLDNNWAWGLLVGLATAVIALLFYLIVCVCAARRPCCGLLSRKRYSTSELIRSKASLELRRQRQNPLADYEFDPEAGTRLRAGALPAPDRMWSGTSNVETPSWSHELRNQERQLTDPYAKSASGSEEDSEYERSDLEEEFGQEGAVSSRSSRSRLPPVPVPVELARSGGSASARTVTNSSGSDREADAGPRQPAGPGRAASQSDSDTLNTVSELDESSSASDSDSEGDEPVGTPGASSAATHGRAHDLAGEESGGGLYMGYQPSPHTREAA